MTKAPISVRNIDKVFRIWKQPSDMLVEALTGKLRHTEFQALRNVSFDVGKGEVVGVMGRNGAGKSTLLRIIAGTLNATGGNVEVNGRISAILELGTGFHPEYTGRDNIFLGGLCLGLSKAEIADKLDEIIDFAELREFIDQPFRTYSSGMQARLTFAVATAVDPDVLIIDEALAVGDARFALKSFDRVRDFRRRGKAILLVSHDINQINSFCDRAILLDRGAVRTIGDPAAVGKIYHELLFGSGGTEPSALALAPQEPAKDDAYSDEANTDFEGAFTAETLDSLEASLTTPELDIAAPAAAEHRYGDAKASIDFQIEDEHGRIVTTLQSATRYRIVCTVTARDALHNACVGVMIRTPRGIEVFGSDSSIAKPNVVFDLPARKSLRITAHFKNHLAPGVYFLTVGVARIDGHKHDMRFDALEFVVEPAPAVYHASLVDLDVKFSAATLQGAADELRRREEA